MIGLSLLRCCTIVAAVVASTPLLAQSTAAQEWPKNLQRFEALLKSDSAQNRHISREDLADEIVKLSEPARAAAIGSLIETFPKQPYRVQLGIAVALSKQPQPWYTENLGQKTKTLYDASQDTLDPTLKRTIDDAIANAKGNYRDAIIDFNSDRIDDIAAVTKKFARTPEAFPNSRYVPNSLYYNSQYLTRAYLLGHPKGEQLVNESNAVLEKFVNNPAMAKSNLTEDAHYSLALNHMLLGDRAKAIEVLKDIEKKYSEDDRVYVYQFFFSKSADSVVDQAFPAPVLAQKTREYIEKYKSISPSDQAQFIDFVTK